MISIPITEEAYEALKATMPRIDHSDQGRQYFSGQFQRLMADNGARCSMSRSGNVWTMPHGEFLLIA
jgi:transposase InsO family protein